LPLPVDNFLAAPARPENALFSPFRRGKTALALAPEGVEGRNVKMGKAKSRAF